MKRFESTALRAVLVALAAVLALAAGATPAVAAEPEFKIVTVAEGLRDPWAIAVLPGGDVLVTEKAGQLRLIRNGVLQQEPVPGVPLVRVGGQGGLLDLVAAPDFAVSRYLYMTIAKPNEDDSLGTTRDLPISRRLSRPAPGVKPGRITERASRSMGAATFF
jgi:glucose/arabinose dehydrogenase